MSAVLLGDLEGTTAKKGLTYWHVRVVELGFSVHNYITLKHTLT